MTFELPRGWELLPLETVVRANKPIVYGIVQAGPEFPNGVPYIKSSDVGGRIRPDDLSRTSPDIARKYARSVVRPGDIVFSLRGNIGELSIVPPTLPEANLTQGTARIAVGDRAHNEFVAMALKAPQLQKRIAVTSKGSTFKEISLEQLRRLEIPVPPLEEQRRIAAVLKTWDLAVEKLELLVAAKRNRMRAVEQRLLGESRATGSNLPRSNWSLATLGQIFEERQDRNRGLSAESVVTVGKYAIRRQSEHFNRSVASRDLSAYWMISPGDFVYDPMSVYYGAIGRYGGTGDGIVSPAYRVLRLRSDVDPDFAANLLRTHHIRFELDRRSSQGNKEGKRRLLQRDEFESIEFKLPPLDLQRELSAKILDFAKDVVSTEDQLRLIETQKRGLMQRLLIGQWRVRN